jgi:hypothetical protein
MAAVLVLQSSLELQSIQVQKSIPEQTSNLVL